MRFREDSPVTWLLTLVLVVALAVASRSQSSAELSPGSADLIRPEELVKALQSPTKPTILNVGPRMIYVQAHIPGAEFVGPANKPEGLEKLRARVGSLPRDSFVVIYCGCCPWEHCPNIRPAYRELKQMGFTRLKVLFIATSFGSDWVEKGYPTAKGEK